MKVSFRIFAIVFSMVGGLVLAGGAMNAAWQHNPQQEIYSEAGINWGYWLMIGGSWLVIGFLLFYILAIPVYKFINHIADKQKIK